MLPSDGGKPKRRQSETARHKTHSATSANLPASSFNPASVRSAPAPRRNHAADLTEASRFPNRGGTDSSWRGEILALREDYPSLACRAWKGCSNPLALRSGIQAGLLSSPVGGGLEQSRTMGDRRPRALLRRTAAGAALTQSIRGAVIDLAADGNNHTIHFFSPLSRNPPL
jgi:hypothetical protein